MDIRYLNYVLTIAKRQNMTKAAEELYVSQSSLSQYLAKLESEIGTPLFYRSKGKLSLTPAGELYVEAAKQVVDIHDRLYQNMQSLDNKGHITIGVTSQFGLSMLTEIIPRFKTHFPDVTIEITETNPPAITKMIGDEAIDCGIVALNRIEPFEKSQVSILRNEEVYFAIPISHPYHIKNPDNPITIDEIAENFKDDNFLVAKRGATLRGIFDEVFEALHTIPSTMCETNSITATSSMVAMGIGVSFIAESCANNPEKIAYYELDPRLFRLNAFVKRKNWQSNEASKYLTEQIENYFKTDSTS